MQTEWAAPPLLDKQTSPIRSGGVIQLADEENTVVERLREILLRLGADLSPAVNITVVGSVTC